ncbi:MAG: ImmA/IrrE family metallo-endopeptidase, partial [Flavobacteriaceae bacterium]
MARAENINPSILTWARETAGLSIDEAAERLGLSSSERASASDKLEAFESGETNPTRMQLLKIAAVYRRPLTTFYKNRPPAIADRGEDFRTSQAQSSRKDNALLDALLRDIRARQDLVRSLLEDDEDTEQLEFIGSLSIKTEIHDVANILRIALNTDEDGWTTRFKSADSLFADLRERVENLGVFVLLIGNLGSHHSNISESVFRGFAIADDIAPFIVINDQDARTARSFTLIHELVHLFLGASGVSGAPSGTTPQTPIAKIERFCNDAASEFLVPAAEITNQREILDIHEAFKIISDFASDRNVSEPLIAYRFRRRDKISDKIYSELSAVYSVRW